jgi:hypothetical protein
MRFPILLETDRGREMATRAEGPVSTQPRPPLVARTTVGGRAVGARAPVGSFWLGQALVAYPRP